MTKCNLMDKECVHAGLNGYCSVEYCDYWEQKKQIKREDKNG